MICLQDNEIARNLINTLEKYGFQHAKNISSATPIFKNRSNVQLRVRYITKESNLTEVPFRFEETSLKLPSAALPLRFDAVVVILWYKALHSFLKTNIPYGNITTSIITASVQPEPDPNKTFASPVRISWGTTIPVSHFHFVFD